ncbi:MAG: hypothetical protein KDA25_11820 [Phycisphaerales bacterium]|nr:hypothetical protein [Phycisphaerales bacterium]
MIRTTRTRVCIVVLCLLASRAGMAHEGLHERLHDVTRRIEAKPDDASLYVTRAGLHHLHRDWPAAFADLDEAARRGADAATTALPRATLLLDVDRPREAASLLDAFIAHHPTHGVAHTQLGRALEAMRRPDAAAVAYERAIRHTTTRRTEQYLDLARALAAAGATRDAVAALDEGLADLGHLVVLQEQAIALERRMGRIDAALMRLDDVVRGAQRPEKWLALRSELLMECGRVDDARAACHDALRAIARLPRARRHTPATLALEDALRRRLDAVGGTGTNPNERSGMSASAPVGSHHDATR